MKKYLKVMLVLVVALSMLCTFAFAEGYVNKFQISSTSTSATSVNQAVNNVGATIISIVQTVGYVVAVVMILVVGIQWLIGTPAKKQELKGKMVNVVIGAILIVAGVSILGLVGKFAEETEKTIISEVEISETYMA